MSIEDQRGRVNNLSQVLWTHSQDLIGATFQLPFIQRLIHNTLDDRIFTLCDQQDRYFEYVVRPYRRFVRSQENSESFSSDKGKEILKYQRISVNYLGIMPVATTNTYIDFIFSNADDFPLAIVSLLPCLKLYSLLTHKLSKANSARYDYWIKRHPPEKSEESIVRLEFLLNNNQGTDIVRLERIFRTGLQHEIAFFSQFDDLI